MVKRQLRQEEYSVGWVCALPVEPATAQSKTLHWRWGGHGVTSFIHLRVVIHNGSL